MRIALLAHAPVSGGSTELFLQIRDFFIARGHVVEPIFGRPATPADPRTQGSWIMPESEGGWRKHLAAYAEKVASFRPDLVYSISGRDEIDLHRFLPFPRVRHVFSLEEHEYFSVPFALRHSRRFTEAYTANTPDTQDAVRRISDRPTYIMPYLFPEPLRAIDEVDAQLLQDSGRPAAIAYVARLERFQKRAHWLPEIIRRCQEAGANLQWHIFGDGPEEGTLRNALQADPRVQFHGWVNRERLYEKLPELDIFFLCSQWEGLPVAMVEAMRCGLACVVPDIPAGMRWALQHGGGWLYAARSPAAAAAKLIEAVANRALLAQRRQEALLLSRQLFSYESAQQQSLELERTLHHIRFNGECLNIQTAPKFRAVSVSAYLRRVLLRRKLS
jgi:glycosyltransferase involved in cell wall biosynthesis